MTATQHENEPTRTTAFFTSFATFTGAVLGALATAAEHAQEQRETEQLDPKVRLTQAVLGLTPERRHTMAYGLSSRDRIGWYAVGGRTVWSIYDSSDDDRTLRSLLSYISNAENDAAFSNIAIELAVAAA